MNCKPGDLAIIIGVSKLVPGLTGLIVEVLYAAPRQWFELPNGVPHRPCNPSDWVVRFMRPVPCPWGPKMRKPNVYGVVPDKVLRPLPGESEPDAAPAPSRELEIV